MSATTAPFPPPTTPRLLTAADLAALPEDGTRHELDNGRLVVMSRPGDTHGAATSKLIAYLVMFGELPGHGKVRNETGVILRRNPDRVVGPDACFIATASLPLRVSSEGYLETIPDLVVEVRSKNDTFAEVEGKVGEYLTAGVKLVWVIDPIRTLAMVHELGHPPRTLGPGDDLTAGAIIPGFRLAVADALRA